MIGRNTGLLYTSRQFAQGAIFGTVFTAQQTELVDMMAAYINWAWGDVGTVADDSLLPLRVAIYGWTGTEAGKLLAYSDVFNLPRDYSQLDRHLDGSFASWRTFLLNTMLALTQGNEYYLCLLIGGRDFAIGIYTTPSGYSRTPAYCHAWGLNLNANLDLADQPPLVLSSSTINQLSSEECNTAPFGVCSFDSAVENFGIYAYKSGGNPTISVIPSAITVRVGTSQGLTASIVGGTPPYTITWTNLTTGTPIVPDTPTTASVSFDTTGIYVIEARVVDAAGLSASATSTITVNPLPSVDPPFPMPPLPDADTIFASIPTPTPPPLVFRYTMDKVGANYIIKDGTTEIYSNSNPQLTLQQLVDLTSRDNADSLVKNVGTLTMATLSGIGNYAGTLRFIKTPCRIYLEGGLIIKNTNAGMGTRAGMLTFDGVFETTNALRNGLVFEGINGVVKLIGEGTSLNERGTYVRCASRLQLRHLDVSNIGKFPFSMDADAGNEVPAHNDYNYYEDLKIQGFSAAAIDASQAFAAFYVDGSHNVARNIRIDGESRASARVGINSYAENLENVYNIFEDIDIRNYMHDGMYFTADAFAVSLYFGRRINIYNTDLGQGGWSAFKYRNAYYCYMEDLTLDTSKDGGLTLGTAMNDDTRTRGTDGLGGPHDGWSRGNRFVRVVSKNCRIAAHEMDIDWNGVPNVMGVEQNYVDGYFASSGMGVWYNNGWAGASGTGVIRDNVHFVTIENCNMAIRMMANYGNAGDGLTYRNYLTGVIKNCAQAIFISDAGCIDNYFDIVIIGAGTISDGGLRTRLNGVGKHSYGAGVTPTASDWKNASEVAAAFPPIMVASGKNLVRVPIPVNDIVINTSDNTAWVKIGSIMTKLNVGDAIAQFTYMEGKGGLPVGTCQFIDKSFVSGRTITGWLWDFGDGTATSTLQHPVHAYATKGTYNVTLTVTDNLANKTTIVQSVDVTEQAYRTLTILPTSNGSTNPASGDYLIADGQTQIVSFSPATNYTFDHWELDGVNMGLQNPIHILMYADHTLTAYSRLIPPEKGTLEVHSFLNGIEVVTQVEIVGIGSYGTPFTIDLDPGEYTLKATFRTQTKTETVNVVSGQSVRTDFRFTVAQAGISPWVIGIALLGVAVGAAYVLKGGKK